MKKNAINRFPFNFTKKTSIHQGPPSSLELMYHQNFSPTSLPSRKNKKRLIFGNTQEFHMMLEGKGIDLPNSKTKKQKKALFYNPFQIFLSMTSLFIDLSCNLEKKDPNTQLLIIKDFGEARSRIPMEHLPTPFTVAASLPIQSTPPPKRLW